MGALKEYLPHYTYDDYLHWDGNWELIFGIAYAMSPAPTIQHQNISSNIAWQLKELTENCKKCQALLPIDWKVSKDTILQPDNLVICHKPKSDNYITKAPVIIFEVLSKATAKKDLTVKFEIYEKEGVKYYITVDPEEEMAKVFTLNNGKFIKVCDATDEKVSMETKECSFEFDFKKIWK